MLEILEERKLPSVTELAPALPVVGNLPPVATRAVPVGDTAVVSIADGATPFDLTSPGSAAGTSWTTKPIDALNGPSQATPTSDDKFKLHRDTSPFVRGLSYLGVAIGPAASVLAPPDGGFPAQVPWFQSSQPDPSAVPTAQTPSSGAMYPVYLGAVADSPPTPTKGADPVPALLGPPAHVPAAPFSSASATCLPAYLKSTEPESSGVAFQTRSLPASSKTPIQASLDDRTDALASHLAVCEGTKMAFFAPEPEEQVPADGTNPTFARIVLGGSQPEDRQAIGRVVGSEPQSAAAPRQDELAADHIDQLFAQLGSQSWPDGNEARPQVRSGSWWQWVVQLTAVAGGAMSAHAIYPATVAVKRTPRFDGLRPPEEK